MNYYNKPTKSFNQLENKLFSIDSLLVSSVMMRENGESIIGESIQSGTDDDIKDKFALRTTIVFELLGIDEDFVFDQSPDKINEYINHIETTDYSIGKFTKQFSMSMNLIPQMN